VPFVGLGAVAGKGRLVAASCAPKGVPFAPLNQDNFRSGGVYKTSGCEGVSHNTLLDFWDTPFLSN